MNLGRLARIKRQQLGYRLEDLTDDRISKSTISKIERNEAGVTEAKINYYLTKLSTTKEELINELSEIDKQENKHIKYLLQGAETILDQFGPKALHDASLCLKTIKIDSAHPQYAKKHFLQGKIYRRQNNYDKANIHLQKAANNEYGQANIRASAYCDLSLIAYEDNNMESSLKHIKQGLSICIPSGKRNYVYYTLLCNKALILEAFGKRTQANEILKTLWNQYEQIEKSYTKCQIHYIQTNIHIDNQAYNDAIKLLNKGIELSRINKLDDLSFVMWTTLGRVLIKKNAYLPAEKCLTVAVSLGSTIENKKLLIKPHIQLGYLYIRQSEWDQAYKNIQQALRLATQYNDVLKNIDALFALGEYFATQGLHKEATISLMDAYQLAKAHNYLEKQYYVLGLLANCFKELDQAKFEDTLRTKYEVELKLEERGYSTMQKKQKGDGIDGT